MSSEEKKENPILDKNGENIEDKIEAAIADVLQENVERFPVNYSDNKDDDLEDVTVLRDIDDLENMTALKANSDSKKYDLKEQDDQEKNDFEEQTGLDEISYEEEAPEEEFLQQQNYIANPSVDQEENIEEQKIEEQKIEKQKSKQYTKKDSINPKRTSGTTRKSARPAQIKYVHMDDSEFDQPIVKKKKHKGLKVMSIIALMLLVSAGTVYAGMSYYYSDKFFEGTTINGINCSGMTAYQVEQIIADKLSDYSIEVKSRNQDPQVITGDKINYRYTPDGEILNILKNQKPYEWILGYYMSRSYNTEEHTAFDKKMLEKEVKSLECAKKENQVEPQNAYVAFNEEKFVIVPETEGSELIVKNAYKLLNDAITVSERSVDFTTAENVYKTASVKSDNKDLKATADAYNNFANASITYTFGENTVTLNGETIKTWLQFDEKGQLIANEAAFQQHIADYVAQLAAEYDTVGTNREFQATDGRVVYVYGAAYGWKIDQAAEIEQLKQEIQSGTQTVREPIYSMRANSHGYNDLGNTYIEVDLSSQHMYYYQDGAIIFDTDIVSGNMSYEDRITPPGIFTLYYKTSPDVLRGTKKPDGTYEYETEVQYWMPFNQGIGFHDAEWQPYFGGDRYLTGGSHGCINLPPDSAAVLYGIIQYGVPIICFY